MQADFAALGFVVPLGAAAAQAVGACIIIAAANDRSLSRSFGALAISMSAWNACVGLESVPGFHDNYQQLIRLLYLGLLFLPAAAVHNAWAMCARKPSWGKLLVGVTYIFSCGFAMLHAKGLLLDGFLRHSWGTIGRPGPLLPLFVIFLLLSVGTGSYLCAEALRRRDNDHEALRAKYWLTGVVVALPFGLTNFLVNYGVQMFPMGSAGSIFLVCLLAYAAVRHRLLDIDVFFMRAAATFLATTFIVLPVAGVWIWLQDLPFGVIGTVVVGALLLAAGVNLAMFSRLRGYLERSVESSLYPARRLAREAIRQFSEDVVKLSAREDLGPRLTTLLVEGLRVRGAALYLARPQGDGFERAAVHGVIEAPGVVTSDPQPGGVDGPETGAAKSDHRRDVEGMRNSWELQLPLRADRTTLGFIALAAKESGGAIAEPDRSLLGVLAAQLAVAIQNGRYIDQIEEQKAEIEELHRRLAAENVALRAEVRSSSQFKEILGSSAALQQTLAVAERVARTDVSVLITGETGTGKELVARAIHDLSPRRDGPLISVNCPAIPPDLAESELFGHERGAFTGAVEARPGKFELAHGGTIFLDEVADLPAHIQVKLLRVLQEREVCRVGGHRTRKLDIRVVAATNRDLLAMMRSGEFREDLYYRLAGMPLDVPPLRRRVTDIPMLASFFLDRAARAYQKSIKGISPDAMNALASYHWPGNIRELQTVIERAVLLCGSDTIHPAHLGDLCVQVDGPPTLNRMLRAEKERAVRHALAQTGNNQAAAARLLGMSRSNLARLIKSLGLKVNRPGRATRQTPPPE